MKSGFSDSKFQAPDQSPGFLLWQVTNFWQRRQRAALAPLELTHVQFALLAGLFWLERTGEPITQIELATCVSIDPMMTSQVVRELEKKGLIRRNPDPGDKRKSLLSSTLLGQELIPRAIRAVEEVDAQFFSILGRSEDKFLSFLKQLNPQSQLSFERVEVAHIPILFHWLNAAHIKGFYDKGYSSEEEVGAKYLTPSDSVERLLVSIHGVPFGYIQYYQVGPTHEYAQYRASCGKTVGIDLFIGEAAFLGRGYGRKMVEKLIATLDRDVHRIIVDPCIDNLSVQFFEKCGFKSMGTCGEQQLLVQEV